MAKMPASSSSLWKAFYGMARLHVAVYRATGGRVGGKVADGRLLLLHHVGRKSGVERVTPILYITDGDALAIAASKGGTDKNPAWYYNLMAAPTTTVEVGRERRGVRPREAGAEERAALWPRFVAANKTFTDYERHAGERTIPVVVLEPA
jgi:F420H(2)-dependent quinone reductase